VNVVQASFRQLHAAPDERPRHRRRILSGLRFTGPLSLALHAALLVGALLWFRHGLHGTEAPDQEGMVELVMVQTKGAGPTTAPREPPPTPSASAPQPSPPDHDEAAEALPLPPPPPPAAQPAAPVPTVSTPPLPQVQEAPTINLGGSDFDTYAIASGPHVAPARPDADYRNKDPAYPAEAARRAEHGAVILLIHVSSDGLASSVDIAESSGFPLLDNAARDAVLTWHFLPAVKDGQAIPFNMPMRVMFRLE
jgi:protein TonB